MIEYTPQRSDFYTSSYNLSNDVLSVSINGVVETFDFSEFPDGALEEITPELLPINPIVGVQRVDGVLNITVIQFYGESEKSDYEN